MENEIIRPLENAGGFTTFRNEILDHIMPDCPPNTWKVICVTLRKTEGWDKEKDKISMSQYQKLTGIKSRPTLISAIQDALDRGYIVREEAGNSFFYEINRDFEISLENKPVQKLNRNQFRNQTEISLENKLTKEKRKKKEDDVFFLPDLLASSPEFVNSWNEFMEHRKQMKKKLTPLATARLVAKLAKYPLQVSVLSLQTSIERGWLGVFPESIKVDNGNTPNTKTVITENGMYI